MLNKAISIFLIVIVSSCANYSRTAIDKLSGQSNSVTITIIKPSIELFEVDSFGEPTLKAEWTKNAMENVKGSIKEYFNKNNINVKIFFDDLNDNQIEYIKLQNVVSEVITGHVVIPEKKLPTKDKEGLEWTLGPGFNNAFSNSNSDYILVLNVRDYFSSGGRVLTQAMMLLLFGTYSPLIQQGYGTLIDVKTGDIVWFDFVQSESFGDTRKKKGADEAVEKILKNLPKT